MTLRVVKNVVLSAERKIENHEKIMKVGRMSGISSDLDD